MGLELELTTINDDDRPIYVTGNFNKWALEDEQFRLRPTEDGKYLYRFPPYIKLPESIEYKYTRGDWNFVELDAYGGRVPNRKIEKGKNIIKDEVPHWRENGHTFDKEFLPKKILIEDDFEIPQLGRKRRIQALIPHDYETSGKSYPVIYMQDAQNLFDPYSPFGNWAIDEKLAVMAERGQADVIVIAIDHAEENRIKEFMPFKETRFGLGEGKRYLQFITETLKPYVDRKYRTLSDRSNTAIGGSSMGGLISVYAGFIHPEIFGRLMIFSPSLWVKSNIHFDIIRHLHPHETKVYLYAGGSESANMVPNLRRLKNAIEKQGGDQNSINFKLTIDPNGRHDEKRWGHEFPRAVEWLFS